MGKDAKRGHEASNLISFEEAVKNRQSLLEKEYLALYGEEFVSDLRQAYLWMRRDMKSQAPEEDIVCRRRSMDHEYGEWVTVFYVDFSHGDFYSQTIDDAGEKTIANYGHSPCLRARNGENLRFLLSGMYFYDKYKTRKWLDALLGEGEKFWAERA